MVPGSRCLEKAPNQVKRSQLITNAIPVQIPPHATPLPGKQRPVWGGVHVCTCVRPCAHAEWQQLQNISLTEPILRDLICITGTVRVKFLLTNGQTDVQGEKRDSDTEIQSWPHHWKRPRYCLGASPHYCALKMNQESGFYSSLSGFFCP
jgi:hypothetical protein